MEALNLYVTRLLLRFIAERKGAGQLQTKCDIQSTADRRS